MKPDIHPKYGLSKAVCACGNTFATRSTIPLIKLEICSACHPFFTGRQKLIDTAGRVDRFKKRFSRTEGKMVKRAPAARMKVKKVVPPVGKPKVLSTAVKAKAKAKEKKKA